jgi:hypothetical protein
LSGATNWWKMRFFKTKYALNLIEVESNQWH